MNITNITNMTEIYKIIKNLILKIVHKIHDWMYSKEIKEYASIWIPHIQKSQTQLGSCIHSFDQKSAHCLFLYAGLHHDFEHKIKNVRTFYVGLYRDIILEKISKIHSECDSVEKMIEHSNQSIIRSIEQSFSENLKSVYDPKMNIIISKFNEYDKMMIDEFNKQIESPVIDHCVKTCHEINQQMIIMNRVLDKIITNVVHKNNKNNDIMTVTDFYYYPIKTII